MELEKYSSLFEKYRDVRLIGNYVEYSKWTIAKLFPRITPKVTLKGNDPVEKDFQSMGGVLVNSLSSSLVQMLFPIGMSFFRIKENKRLEQAVRSVRQEPNFSLVDIENQACERVLSNAGYASLNLAIALLIVTGNVLLHRRNGSLVCYNMNQYSMLRDNDGTVLDIIIKEGISFNRLPDDVRSNSRFQNRKEFDIVDMYTRVKRVYDSNNNPLWEVSTQIEDLPLGDNTRYHEKLCPYIPVVWSSVPGNSYGHGLVEDYAGDFAKLSMLSEALALYEIDACHVINLVKPGTGADIDALADADTGEWVLGDPDTIGKLEGGNYQMITAILADIQAIWERLSIACMYQANVRDAERVTAEEIKMKIRETDKSLGGVYSQLSKSLHLPLAYLLITEILPELVPAVISGEIDLDIMTGTSALGRSADVENIMRAFEILSVLVPASKQISARFDSERITDKVLKSFNVKLEDITYTEEELQQQQAQQQQMLMQQQASMMGGDVNPLDIGAQLGAM